MLHHFSHIRFPAHFPFPHISVSIAGTLFKHISFHAHLIFPFPIFGMCQLHATKMRTKPASVSSPVHLHEEVAREKSLPICYTKPEKGRITLSFRSNMAKILQARASKVHTSSLPQPCTLHTLMQDWYHRGKVSHVFFKCVMHPASNYSMLQLQC